MVTGEMEHLLRGHSDIVDSVAFSSDGHRVVSCSSDIRNTVTGEMERKHEGHLGAVAFSPDGHRMISGSNDYTVRIWNVGTGEVEHVLQGRLDRVTLLHSLLTGHALCLVRMTIQFVSGTLSRGR